MDLKMNFDLDKIRNIDPKNMGSAPLFIRIGAMLLAVAAILGAGYYFDTQPQREILAREEAKEPPLRQTFEDKQRRAANLEALKQQLEEMERTFGALLQQLPNQTEIPGLLVDVSQTALASGLEIELFRPGGESKKGFYAELPIALRMKGGYHDFGNFVSGVAALPRIVTIGDVTLTPNSDDGSKMTFTATAKTYRYVEGSDG
ncbi:MAG: type 4a pilus biogenesis protein PilO [Chromatiales bacterium]|jgi:type IV pilus assembly protein PilO|nr:type 4a pilus biogenesis protein PilO [Chromatiales bacterium]MDX9767356.1 type 4a pilus biogenesis protein PilO [Ectothiorhodospiraceae bacterium]